MTKPVSKVDIIVHSAQSRNAHDRFVRAVGFTANGKRSPLGLDGLDAEITFVNLGTRRIPEYNGTFRVTVPPQNRDAAVAVLKAKKLIKGKVHDGELPQVRLTAPWAGGTPHQPKRNYNIAPVVLSPGPNG
jgi:hypothetical protein